MDSEGENYCSCKLVFCPSTDTEKILSYKNTFIFKNIDLMTFLALELNSLTSKMSASLTILSSI